MNDRFKFRGYWYNDILKEWRVFDKPEFITGDGTAEIWCDSEGGAYPELPPYADLHLCQCTGLKDKNGKLIYEGDVVNGSCGVYWGKMIVEYNVAGFVLNKKGKRLNFLDGDNFIEVIGNIYENKELLDERN